MYGTLVGMMESCIGDTVGVGSRVWETQWGWGVVYGRQSGGGSRVRETSGGDGVSYWRHSGRDVYGDTIGVGDSCVGDTVGMGESCVWDTVGESCMVDGVRVGSRV